MEVVLRKQLKIADLSTMKVGDKVKINPEYELPEDKVNDNYVKWVALNAKKAIGTIESFNDEEEYEDKEAHIQFTNCVFDYANNCFEYQFRGWEGELLVVD